MNNNDNVATTSVNLDRPTNPAEAKLAAAEQYASEVQKGSTILAQLPPNATHGELRALIEADHQRLYASAGLPVSHSKGDHA